MELINFDEYQQNKRFYGGRAGRKLGINYNGDNYIIKFAESLKEKNFKNINLSYSNSPISEYIGSHIYEILGKDVHDTILGTRGGKLVVACKDFCENGDVLYEFEKLKTTFEPKLLNIEGEVTNGEGTELDIVLQVIREHPTLSKIDGVEEHFWDMFVVDALIGNGDRNNGNWGIIISSDGTEKISPVFDNGNSLNNKWADKKMLETLLDENSIRTSAYNGSVCIFKRDEKRINPYHMLKKHEYTELDNALLRMVPQINLKRNEIINLINDISIISNTKKQFLNTIVDTRIDNVLIPSYNEISKSKIDIVEPRLNLKRGR